MAAYPPPSHSTIIIYFVLIIILLFPWNDVHADVWSISMQNDLIVGTDERYTSGISLSWMSDALDNQDLEDSDNHYVNFIVSVFSILPMVNTEADYTTVGFNIAQDIYTPKDTYETELIDDDIPYAGHLYTKYSLFEWHENEVEEFFFKIGVVGPSSGGEGTQKSFHQLFGIDNPEGWEHQLPDYPTLDLGYADSFSIWRHSYQSGLESDWITSYGLELGNFMTGAFGGLSFRFGQNYPTVQAPAFGSVDSGLNSRLALNTDKRSFGWSASVEAYLNAVAYSHIFDSSNEHDIERKALAGMVTAGFAMFLKNVQLSFSVQSVNLNINGRLFTHGWGGITLSIKS